MGPEAPVERRAMEETDGISRALRIFATLLRKAARVDESER